VLTLLVITITVVITVTRHDYSDHGHHCTCLDDTVAELEAGETEITDAVLLLRRLYPTGDSASVAELITQAANEIRRLREIEARVKAIQEHEGYDS